MFLDEPEAFCHFSNKARHTTVFLPFKYSREIIIPWIRIWVVHARTNAPPICNEGKWLRLTSCLDQIIVYHWHYLLMFPTLENSEVKLNRGESKLLSWILLWSVFIKGAGGCLYIRILYHGCMSDEFSINQPGVSHVSLGHFEEILCSRPTHNFAVGRGKWYRRSRDRCFPVTTPLLVLVWGSLGFTHGSRRQSLLCKVYGNKGDEWAFLYVHMTLSYLLWCQ